MSVTPAMSATLRIASIVPALALCAGCAALAPRLAKPELVGASVRIASIALPEIRLAIDLELANPNAVEIALDALVARVALEGEPVATATLDRPVRLPANATARVPTTARGDAAAALGALGRALGSGRALRYELTGEATLADGTRFPFARRGETGPNRR